MGRSTRRTEGNRAVRLVLAACLAASLGLGACTATPINLPAVDNGFYQDSAAMVDSGTTKADKGLSWDGGVSKDALAKSDASSGDFGGDALVDGLTGDGLADATAEGGPPSDLGPEASPTSDSTAVKPDGL